MDNTTKWDLIIVGLGDLGHRVAAACHASGLQVLGIRRQRVERDYPTLATDLHGDALAAMGLRCHCLVYAVAADQRTPEGYQSAYPLGFARARQAIQADRAIFVSSTRIFGQNVSEWIDENSPAEPADWAGEALLDAEQYLAAGDCALVLGGIYGPQRERMLSLAKQGAWCQPGYLTNRIHIADAASLCRHLVQRCLTETPLPPRVIGVDGEGADMADVLTWCREQLGVAAKPAAEIQPPKGKKCRSILFESLAFTCQYPDFRTGYRDQLPQKDTL
jgi:nucleoside-diphosphate-sugar epimerase